MPATLKAKPQKGSFRTVIKYPPPLYDLGPTLEMLLPDGQRRALRIRREQLEAMSEFERNELARQLRREWRKNDRAQRLRERRILNAIESVVSPEDWEWYQERQHEGCY
jgi:hypothetical protein